MSSIFCCSNTQLYKNCVLSHESKFQAFTTWARYPKESAFADSNYIPPSSNISFVIQVVKQTNYGPLDSKRYFVSTAGGFQEVTEQWLVDANFGKLNT